MGGLFAGVVLKRLGRNVRILERNPTPLLHNQGAGIVAGGDVQAWFDRYDLTKTPIAVTSPWRQYLDRNDAQIHREDWEQKMTSWDLLYNLLRANFDASEHSYCVPPPRQSGDGEAEYVYGCTVTAVRKQDDGKVEVSYVKTDGQEEKLSADLLIAADGPSSAIRRLFDPAVERTYAGYVAWRGTVPEAELSQKAKETLVEKFTFFHAPATQILCYLIPGEKGTLQRGERLLNWVWYRNAESPEAKAKFLTDSDGKVHNVTMPVGKVNPDARKENIEAAERILPPVYAELVRKTKQPFVQAITDVLSTRNTYLDGKVLLLGDAVAGFRPHTAASTGQAAFDAMLLAELVQGKMTLEEWEKQTMQYARETQQRGVQMGDRSQFGSHPLAR